MPSLFLDPKASAVGQPFPASFKLLIDAIAQHMGVEGLGSFSGINFGSGTPAVADQDKPWLKLDVSDLPLGWHTYTGAKWEPIIPIGTIQEYDGDINDIAPGFLLLDGVGTYQDKDDVSQPVPDHRNKMILGAGDTYAVGDTGGSDTVAVSFALPANTGSQTLTTANLPSFTVPFTPELSGDSSPVSFTRLTAGNANSTLGNGSFTLTFTGTNSSFTVPLGGNVGGNVDVRSQFISQGKIIYVAV